MTRLGMLLALWLLTGCATVTRIGDLPTTAGYYEIGTIHLLRPSTSIVVEVDEQGYRRTIIGAQQPGALPLFLGAAIVGGVLLSTEPSRHPIPVEIDRR